MSFLSGVLGGGKTPKGYQTGSVQQFTPEQMQLFQSLFSHLSPGSYLSRLAGGDESIFRDIEAPAWKQFGEAQGQNASRFSGFGMGARNGSGFQNSQNQASVDFATGLASRRQEMQRQAISDLLGMGNQLLGQRPQENFLVRKQNRPSFLQSLIGGGSALAGAAIGGSLGGVPGAALGSQLGGGFGSGFTQTNW